MNRLLEYYILKHYRYISFDIFDTLIERDVPDPVDIFSLVEIETGEANFKVKRIQAEKVARSKSDSREVTIEDIYKEYVGTRNIQDYLKEAELRMEAKHIHIKRRMFSFYCRCISDNKTVFLTSDMYLTGDFLETILNGCGIKDYKHLYVSCDYHKSKVNSDLFEEIVNNEHIDKKELIHIGDSPRADFIGAHKAGINSVLILRKAFFKCYLGKLISRMKFRGK